MKKTLRIEFFMASWIRTVTVTHFIFYEEFLRKIACSTWLIAVPYLNILNMHFLKPLENILQYQGSCNQSLFFPVNPLKCFFFFFLMANYYYYLGRVVLRCRIKANCPLVGPGPVRECHPSGSFWEILACIYASFGENHEKL